MRYLLNRHVHRDYNRLDPVTELVTLPGARASPKRLWARDCDHHYRKHGRSTLRAETITAAAVLTCEPQQCHNSWPECPSDSRAGRIEIQSLFHPLAARPRLALPRARHSSMASHMVCLEQVYSGLGSASSLHYVMVPRLHSGGT